MRTRLRHLKGDNLNALEETLERIKSPHIVTAVNFVKGNWYIHLLMQKGELNPTKEIEIVQETTELNT